MVGEFAGSVAMNAKVHLPSAKPGRAAGLCSSRSSIRIRKSARAQATASGSATRSAGDVKDLKNPAHIKARGKMSRAVKDFGGTGSLENYMRLPVEQYSVLDPKLIKMLGEDRFELKVPRIDVMGIWIEPLATVKVTQFENPPRVNLKTEYCEINGSDELRNLHLDGKFFMLFEANLQWENGIVGTTTNGSRSQAAMGKMIAASSIDVYAEVQPPFNLMPKEILESTCNIAMDGLMSTLLPLFMSNLSNDYREWATSETYRTKRAQPTWATLPSQTF